MPGLLGELSWSLAEYSVRGVDWCFGKGRGAVKEGGAEECCKIRRSSSVVG